jgi:hypothetical protein
MENQHEAIKGYRDLSQEEVDLMNLIKQKGSELEELCVMLGARARLDSDLNSPEYRDAARWVAIGKTHMQEGLQAWVRSVARPESF